VRRRLADRRIQSSEEGLRGRLASQLALPTGLGFSLRWPFAGSGQAIDLVGVDASGSPVVGFVRERFSLEVLGEALDAALAAEPLLPLALREATGPVQIGERPRLAFAFREPDAAGEAVLARLALASTTLRADGDVLRAEGEVARTARPEAEESGREPGRRRRRRGRGRGRDRDREYGDEDGRSAAREDGRSAAREDGRSTAREGGRPARESGRPADAGGEENGRSGSRRHVEEEPGHRGRTTRPVQ
jgi:hypothetical protein